MTPSPATSSRPTGSTPWDATSPPSTRCRTGPATSTTTPRPSIARCATTASPAASTTAAGNKDNFFARFSYEKYKLDAPQGQAACCLPTPDDAAAAFDLGPFVAGIQNTRLTTMGGAASWTHLFGPTVVNELRVGFAKTNPETRQSDYGHQSSTSLGIQGINVSDYTTGLPNLNIQDMTGISGGPAFLPVNPKQIHYQVEDTLSLVKGRHSFKTGYRFLLRKPTPFTHTNTRSSISVNRNLTNNPPTNSQGSGISTLLLGYTTGGSRGFLLDFYDLTNSEHSAFVQDDWKASERLTINAGLRYEVYVPDTEAQDRLPNYDPRRTGARLRRRKRRPPRQQEDAVGQLRPSARRRLGRDRRREERAARGLRPELLPGAATRPGTCSTRTCPTRSPRTTAWRRTRSTSRPPASARSRTRSRPSCRSSRGPPRSSTRPTRSSSAMVLERDPAHGHLAGELRAAAHEHADGGGRLRGQQGIEPIWVGNINEVQPGPGSAGLAAADPAPLQRGHRSSTSTPSTARATTACRSS